MTVLSMHQEKKHGDETENISRQLQDKINRESETKGVIKVSSETKRCVRCGCELESQLISKFDSRYCIYCQNQNSGSLETSAFVIARDMIVKYYFMEIHKMDKAIAIVTAEEMIRKNPFIIRKVNCKPCTLGVCSIEFEDKLKGALRDNCSSCQS